MNTTHKRSARLASALLLAVLILTACDTSGSGSGTDDASTANGTGCTPSTPTVAPDTPTIAVLGQTGPRLADYQQDINTVLSSAKTQKAHLIVNGVTDGTDAPDLVANVVLAGQGANPLERTNDLDCKTTAVTTAIETLKTGTAPKQPNAFDAISTLAGNLDKNPSTQPVDVVLLTPLAAKAGTVDLSASKTLDDPVAAINTLAANGLIPTCTKYRFYGVSPAIGMSDVDAAKLREFWMLYAQKCGGRFVAWTDHLAAFPVSEAITPVDYSQITVQRAPTSVTATIGSDVLFDADSATLQSKATQALTELLALATQNSGKITITGYVNPVTPGGNSLSDQVLSQQRAKAVAAWLIAHGIAESRITTVGKGTADAVYPDPQTETERAANRRVVAVIQTPAG
jgi:outer membrane protein OmpA-like peptidoglycan-associated protein